MTVALIKTSPKTIIATAPNVPPSMTLPTGDVVEGAAVGWTSQDGAYAIVAVTSFVPPNGQVNVGNPSYAFDAGGNVAETYTTQAAPLNVILFPAFIGRWTTAEYALLMQKRAAAVSAGTAGGMTMVMQWDQAASNGAVDLNSAAAVSFKANLVSAAVLTQARADAIFS